MYKEKKKLFALCLTFAMLLTMVAFPKSVSASTTLGGADRYATALEIVQAGWTKSENAIIARGDDLADALAAAPLAYSKGKAPILLTKPGKLPTGVLDELKSLGVKNVYIVGGTGAVSTAVENALKDFNIKRLTGKNRSETSYKVATEAFKVAPTEIVIANGLAYADALSISSIAATKGMPILLVVNNQLSADVSNYISGKTVYAVGGTGVLSQEVVNKAKATRLSGIDRYETNAAILDKFTQDYSKIYLAKGTNGNLVDALAGSALAAIGNNPIVLVNGKSEINAKSLAVVKANISVNSKEVLLGGTVVESAADTVEVLKPKIQINSISDINDVNANYGTVTTNLALPKEITLKLSDGTIAIVDVTWINTDYDGTKTASYTFVGTYILPEGVSGTMLEAKVTVVVGTNPNLADIDAANASVIAYEAAPITTAAEVRVAEALRPEVAVTDAVNDNVKKEAFLARIAVVDIKIADVKATLLTEKEAETLVKAAETSRKSADVAVATTAVAAVKDATKVVAFTDRLNKIIVLVDVSSVILNKTECRLTVGSVDNIIAIVNPTDAASKYVIWSSSDNNVATIDNTGKVTAISVGTATINVITVDGNKAATCNVTVTKDIIRNVKVQNNEGNIVKNAHVLFIADNNTYAEAFTDELGVAKVELVKNNPYSLYVAGDNILAYFKEEVDISNDIGVSVMESGTKGSIICSNGIGYIPGLDGRLNFILDDLNRTYLHADNIAIDGGVTQPGYFTVDKPINLIDSKGVIKIVTVKKIKGVTSLIEYENVSSVTEKLTRNVKVQNNVGNIVKNAHVLFLSDNNTYVEAMTNELGVAKVELLKNNSYSLYIAGDNILAYCRDKVDISNDIEVSVMESWNKGSIICSNGIGYIPGLDGRLNFILDDLNRTYLHADNIAIDGGVVTQSGDFTVDKPINLMDSKGVIKIVTVMRIKGKTSLIEYE